MQLESLAIVAAIFFFAAFIKGTTGLGFSTSALPFLVLAIGLKPALPLLIIPSLASNLMVMVDAGHFRSTAKRFWPLYLAALPGVALGLYMLDGARSVAAGAVLGGVLALYGAFDLWKPQLALPPSLEKPLAPAIGLLTGTLNGLTGSQVMPVLPYLMSLHLPPARFVQAINISFSLSSVVMAVGLAQIGLMTWETLAISAGGLVPVYLGVALGNRIRRHLSPAAFRRIVMIALIIFGLVLVGKALG